jgi:hypothetical protein
MDSAPRIALTSLLALLSLGLASPPAAAKCGDIYPGALQGPPPEWNFWADGSACYVRWKADGGDESQLASRCRNMQGVRFVYFEPDSGAGSICVFKLLNPPSADEDNQPELGVEAAADGDLRSTHYRKSDAENPLLDEMKLLVTTWTEKCLRKETAKKLAGAGRCWKGGAEAIREFTSEKKGLLSQQFKDEIAQLAAAWQLRSDQLEPYIVADAEDKPEAIIPTSMPAGVAQSRGPDPRRLAETAMCSSIKLGDRRGCLRPPVAIGADTYVFGVKSNCSAGVVAAVKTYSPEGRCIRKVVVVMPTTGRSDEVTSHAEPGVLDAISYRDRETFECYARRHDEISCDGKTDYGASPAFEKSVAVDKGNYKAQPETGRKKRGRKDEENDTRSLLTTVTTGLKDLFRSDGKD